MMLFFRLWLFGLIVGGGWALVCFLFTRDRRYLRTSRAIVLSSLLFAAVLVGLRFLQRIF